MFLINSTAFSNKSYFFNTHDAPFCNWQSLCHRPLLTKSLSSPCRLYFWSCVITRSHIIWIVNSSGSSCLLTYRSSQIPHHCFSKCMISLTRCLIFFLYPATILFTYAPLKRRSASTRLQGAISVNVVIFMLFTVNDYCWLSGL
jgi:hypothetical protein